VPDHPKAVGDRSEAHVLAALVDHYPTVLTPWGENCRYDFVIETGDRELLRVQCKTGRLRRGAVQFHARSFTYHHPRHVRGEAVEHRSRGYADDVDLFAVYCRDNGKVYLVPVEEVPASQGSLRVEPAKNGQNRRIRWAAQYELHPPE
jgi:hypothetical protein